jgi:uncharacterized phiE125 gp8 family phage protein
MRPEPAAVNVLTPPNAEVWFTDLMDFFKDQHIRVNTGTDEDQAIRQYLNTAFGMFELHSNGRTVLSTTFSEHTSWRYRDRPLRLSKGKVTAINAVKYHDADDVLRTLTLQDYAFDVAGTQAILWMQKDQPETNAKRPRPVVIEYIAGWTPEQVPSDVKQGIFLLATHYYQFKGDEETDIPQGFVRLANKYHTGITYWG